ncbi:MAG: acyl-CoA dehydrogenase [Archangium sp.]
MNPLVSDRYVDHLLARVLDLDALFALPRFTELGVDSVKPWMDSCRRVARDVLFPNYRAIDAHPPKFADGKITVHPAMHDCWRALRELDVIEAVHAMPLSITTLSSAYLMAGNLSAYGYAGLTAGAAHLIEAFASDELKNTFLSKMRSGEWTGTMALTEPHAGSSLGDLTTRATPTGGGHHLIRGAKIFISAGDHDLAENVVHLTLARIDGAPAGTKGISLFAVPRVRPDGKRNDVHVTGAIHKIGWRGLPSLALAFGEDNDCHGWLVGPPHQGLRCMFQMMNEARIMVGVNGASTASVAFHESLAYAKERKQGRPLKGGDPSQPQVALTEHADVRRMLLRQKAIVEGSLGLLAITSEFADLAAWSADEAQQHRAKQLLDLLTPIAKTFPAERGFESNALALQLHGGNGYSSEFLPEAWLRDQKLNTIHEGTTTIQGLDLLGRKVVAGGGAALGLLVETIEGDCAKSKLDVTALREAVQTLVMTTTELGGRGLEGDVEGMMGHSADFLEAMSSIAIAWVWVRVTNALVDDDDFAKGLRAAANYWAATELPKAVASLKLCSSGERSFLDARAEWF